ncbi:GNAT family N-acetyltransferase [Ramlibacter tataouinensis]|uniref:GNAT family N-acetyltransferase n=1 Tax=Ramlibacter tataouinensis TaxID=94132 RepID=UPI0009EE32E2
MVALSPAELFAEVRLRPAVKTDADTLFTDYFGLAETATFLQRKCHTRIAETEHFVERWCNWKLGDLRDSFAWVICGVESSRPNGIVLVIRDRHVAEIHFGVAPVVSGRGIAGHAVCLATDWLLGQSGVRRVWTAVDASHAASRRVLEKAGFSEEGCLQKWLSLPALGSEPRDAIALARVR